MRHRRLKHLNPVHVHQSMENVHILWYKGRLIWRNTIPDSLIYSKKTTEINLQLNASRLSLSLSVVWTKKKKKKPMTY